MKTVIIGMGNTAHYDDGAGVEAARLLSNCAREGTVEVKEAYAGGLRLMDELVGFDRAIIIDSIVSFDLQPGTILDLPIDGLMQSRNTVSSHDTNLKTAIDTGRALGLKLPHTFSIKAISAKNVDIFKEGLTPDVQKAVYKVVDEIKSMLSTEAIL